MNARFSEFSLDELHTLATALGNAIKNMVKEHEVQQFKLNKAAVAYIARCIRDAESLLAEVNEAMDKAPVV